MKYEEEETKDQTMVLLIINSIIAIILGIAIILIWCVDHVYASTWVSIYDKSNFNNELAYTGNLSYPVLICTPLNNNLCTRVSSTRGNSIANWNQVGFNIKEELNYNQGDTITFNITFKVIQQGSVLSCSNWGMGAETHLQNRLGTSQTINNRNWERITCNHNVTSTGSEEVAVYNYSGSFVATDDGTALSFMFPSNTNYTSNGVMRYGEVNVTLNAQTDNTNEIINNNTQNSQNIINNQNQNTQDIINNQNQNNQELIDTINNQNRVCNENIIYRVSRDNIAIENKFLSSTGSIENSNEGGISDYLRVDSHSTVIVQNPASLNVFAFCWYDENQTLISCETFQRRQEITVLPPTNTYYIRTSVATNQNQVITITGTYCYDYREKEQEQMDEFLNYDHNFGNQSDTSYADTTHQNEEIMTQNLDGNLTNVSIEIDSDANGIIWQIIENTIHQNTIVFVMVVTILSLGIVKLVLGR